MAQHCVYLPKNPAGDEFRHSTIGIEEISPLYEDIKGKLASANGANNNDKVFYGLKHYFASKLRLNDGRLLLRDVKKIKGLKEWFESTTKKLDDKANDYDDLCFYGMKIKDIIKECENLFSAECGCALWCIAGRREA